MDDLTMDGVGGAQSTSAQSTMSGEVKTADLVGK
jgi:hypothetical protein